MESSPEYGTAVIRQFIKNMQPQLLKSKQKKHISDFYKYYFTNFPDVPTRSIEILLLGYDTNKGLLASCGNTNVKTLNSVKMSSVLALELVASLIDPTQNKYAEKYSSVLSTVPLKTLESMKLDRHILSEHGNKKRNLACKFVYMLSQFFPKLSVHEYVPSEDAMHEYDTWCEENIEQESDSEIEPERWSDIKIEDYEKELAEKEEEMGWDDTLPLNEIVDPLGLKKGASLATLAKAGGMWRKLKLMKSTINNEYDEKQTNDSIEQNGGSLSTGDINFNPILFLHDVHRHTSMNELEKGLLTLQKATNSRAYQMKQLVKDHFNQFVYSKDTIDTIHEMISHEVSRDVQISKTGKLGTILSELDNKTMELYGDVLQRDVQTTRIRKLLQVLHRFPVLFKLSGSIRKNILSGEYAKVVRDYKKYKAFQTPVKPRDENIHGLTVPQKVLNNIQAMIKSVHNILLEKLNNPKARLEDQQRIIGYLLELDCEEDPAWYYLIKQKDWIDNIFETAFEDHQKRIQPFNDDNNRHDSSSSSIIFPHSQPKSLQIAVDHSTATLIKQLCYAMDNFMPNFVNLASDVATGKFARIAVENSLSSFKQIPSPAQHEQVYDLIGSLLKKYCTFIRSVIFPVYSNYYQPYDGDMNNDSRDELILNSPSSYKSPKRNINNRRFSITYDTQPHGFVPISPSMQQNVHLILMSYHYITKLQNFPSSFLTSFTRLSSDLIKFFCHRVFTNAFFNLSNLSSDETWEPNPENTRITMLPVQMEKIFLQLLEDLTCIPKQRLKQVEVISAIVPPFLECIRAFADCMHYLGTSCSSLKPSNDTVQNRQTQQIWPSSVESSDVGSHLLIVLSNITHASEHIIPDLWELLTLYLNKTNDTELDDSYQDALDTYDAIELLFFRRYVRVKSSSLCKLIKYGLYESGVDWSNCTPARNISNYMFEVLLQFVSIHDEISITLPEERGRILDAIVQNICSCMYNYITDIDRICPNGALRLGVEVTFFQKTMIMYVNHESKVTLRKIQNVLNSMQQTFTSSEKKLAVKRINKILSDMEGKTKLLFMCLKEDDNE